jgi:uncharacterized damage-inducible protein DinB
MEDPLLPTPRELGAVPGRRPDAKAALQQDLQAGRDAVLWKLEGLSGYDVRRPMTPTGTNLLGMVKHLAFVELGYFGGVFGRPATASLAWMDAWTEDDGMAPDADMWATADESPAEIVKRYRQVWSHADATIEALPLEAPGVVPWWRPERRDVTLQQILVHVVAETHRHAGHADIVRELIDGAAGLRATNDNLAPGDPAWWANHHDRLEQVAREAGGRAPGPTDG